MDSIKTGLAPIARSDARLFILGSLPGERSLAEARYYAHPTNQFWRLVGAAIGEDLHALDYDGRLERFAERGIGLWDVVASARRPGSLDQAIRDPSHNMIAELPKRFPELEAIAFNGRRAATEGRRLLGPSFDTVALIDLPSSSSAFTRPFADKARDWAVLAHYCRPPRATPR